MDHAFWHQRWQLEQIGFHSDIVNKHLQANWPLITSAEKCRVFVPLCGKSRDMYWLRTQGCDVVGVELSPLAVQFFFTEHDLQPVVSEHSNLDRHDVDGLSIYCCDFFALTADHVGDIDAVWDRASLVALPPSMRVDYAKHMQNLLQSGNKILLVAFEYPQHEMQGPPFSVQRHEIDALFASWCDIEWLYGEDILVQEAHFRDRGLSSLKEQVYRLSVR
jgi:thiopurine S-methyltransferase